MRSILKKDESEKKSKRYNLIAGLLLIAIMLFSTAGYTFYNTDIFKKNTSKKTINYNGIEFKPTDYDTWQFEISGFAFETKFNPEQTENASVIMTKTIQDYQGKILYLGIGEKNEIFQAGNREILKNLDQFILRSNFACLSENCEENYPIKNCSESNIVSFKNDESSFTRIRDEEDCVIIYSSEEDAEMAADAFLFRILGIQ